MVNAQEPEAQRQWLGLEAEAAARGVQQNGDNNQPRVVDRNRAVDGLIPPQRQPIPLRGRAQHPAHMMYDEDDADLDVAGATGAIILPVLPLGVKFTITNTMIQLWNLKGMFRGAAGDDANQHLMNFVAIYKSQKIPGFNQTTMRLRLFPLSLTGEATNWLNEMLDDSIRT
uniref:Retrotransposon n=1 Tax=Solanum tuberosum TaxID=4113 RepID=M1DSJ3_SOLTU